MASMAYCVLTLMNSSGTEAELASKESHLM